MNDPQVSWKDVEKLSPDEKRQLLVRLRKQKANSSNGVYLPAHGQKALWFLDRLAPDSAANNEAFAWRIQGELNVADMKRVVFTLLERHAALRTTYENRGGEPCAVVQPKLEVPLGITHAAQWSNERLQQALAEEANRPFDLQRGPLMRIHVFRRDTDSILLTTIHHIAIDLWSMVIVMEELAALYLAQRLGVEANLPPVLNTCQDFSRWQADLLRGPEGQRQRAYWLRQLAGELPVLNLPTDRPRPAVQTYRGSTYSFRIPERLTNAMEAIARANNTTLYTTLLSVYQILLARYSGQEDMLVGSVAAGRTAPQFQRVVGYLANPIALRADLSGDPPFEEFLARVRETVLGAMDNQDYPFSLLIEQLLKERDPSRSPLIDAVFIFQQPNSAVAESQDQQGVTLFSAIDKSGKGAQVNLAGSPAELFLLEHHIAKFDLELEMFRTGAEITGWMRYNTDLFDPDSIARMVNSMFVLMESIVCDSHQRLSKLPLLSSEELSSVRAASSPCAAQNIPNVTSLPVEDTICRAIERRVAIAGDEIAVAVNGHGLSCSELNIRANRLAHYLHRRGVCVGTRVGVWMKRSADLVVSWLAVLKTGATLVPLEFYENGPQVRAALAATNPSFVLRRDADVARHQLDCLTEPLASGPQFLRINREDEPIDHEPATDPNIEISPESPAILWFTMTTVTSWTHRLIIERLRRLQQEFELAGSDVMLHAAPISHDSAVCEVLWPLVSGARLVIADTVVAHDPNALVELLSVQHVTVAQFAPSTLSSIVTTCQRNEQGLPAYLRQVLSSGEPLRQSLVDAFYEATGGADYKHPVCRLSYLYAPRKLGKEATLYHCRAGEANEFVPLGRPLTQMAVLDRHREPLPFRVRGDLCVQTEREHDSSKAGVARDNWQDTGDRGWLNPDGTFAMEIPDLEARGGTDKTRHTYAWISGVHVRLADVEDHLCHHPTIEDCAVLYRNTEQSGSALVAYVVTAQPPSTEGWRAHLEALLPDSSDRVVFVPVQHIPLTTNGQVNRRALAQLEIIDSELATRWEEALQSLPEIGDVRVVVHGRQREKKSLALSELLPAPGKGRLRETPLRESESASQPSRQRVGGALKGTSARPAVSQAEPLRVTADTPQTLVQLLRRIRSRPPGQPEDQRAVIYLQSDGKELCYSMRALLDEAEHIAIGLRRRGLQPGVHVILQLDKNSDFVPSLWGCVLAGAVPVPLAVPPSYQHANANLARFEAVLEMLNRPVVLAGRRPAAELTEATVCPPSDVVCVDELRDFSTDNFNFETNLLPDDIALLLMTSGSTGAPKGVMLSHRNLLSMCLGTIQRNEFNDKEVSLNWMAPEHVGAIVPHMIMPLVLGCTQIHAPTQTILEDPLRWLDLIDRYRVTLAWAPNFAYALINRCIDQLRAIAADRNGSSGAIDRRWDLSSLKFLINAGEMVSKRTARRFLELMEPHGLRPWAMRPAFGMSETASGITWSTLFPPESEEHVVRRWEESPQLPSQPHFVDLGPPIPGASLRIVDDAGEVVDEGHEGNLQVQGPSVFVGYFGEPQTRGADEWFDTGDRGFLHNGRLTLTGRRKDILVINGNNYPSHVIEVAVEEIDGVEISQTAACAVRLPENETEELAIFFCPSNPADCSDPPDDESEQPRALDRSKLLERIREHVVRQVGVNPSYLIPLKRSQIPRTAVGKIQRAHLVERFQNGEFNGLLANSDSSRVLPEWFFEKVYRPRQVVLRTQRTPDRILVLHTSNRLAAVLCERLEHKGFQCVGVESGTAFEQLSPDAFRIDPADPGDYAKLFNAANASCPPLREVIQLMDSTLPSSDRSPAACQLLGLIKALGAACSLEHPVCLTVVSVGAQTVLPTDVPVSERTAIPPLLLTAAQEIPGLSVRHVDLPPERRPDVNAELVMSEICGVAHDREIVYRNGQRLVPRLERVQWGKKNTVPIPFQQRGTYLISGGLGGVGSILAKYLLREYNAQLLILGRKKLPDQAIADSQVDPNSTSAQEHVETMRGQQRLEVLRELQRLGDIRYESVDVSDGEGVRMAVDRAVRHWQRPLDGVIHLAGIATQCALTDEQPERFVEAMRAKVRGAEVLAELVRQQPDRLFLTFSSVNSFFGGALAGAYAAANRTVESVVHELRRLGASRSFCYAWSMLDEVGMSQGFLLKDLTRARGYHLLNESQWLNSLLVALHHNLPQLYIGLDGENPYILRYRETADWRTQQLTAYFTLANGCEDTQDEQRLLTHLHAIKVPDRFGHSSRCRFALQPNREALLRAIDNGLPGDVVPPRNEREREVLRFFQELLDNPHIGIYDSFFGLGGHSLLAVQLMTRLSRHFEMELPVQLLFGDPTVAGVAQAIESYAARSTASGNGAASILDRSAPDLLAEAVLDLDIVSLLDESKRKQEQAVDTSNPANIFMTGATGFLGSVLLGELLRRTNADVHCLVRAQNTDEGVERIVKSLSRYSSPGEQLTSSMIARIRAVSGDLAEPSLGLSTDQLHDLAGRIDVIYHSGAQVNFFFPYTALEGPNVRGTREVLRLACRERVKPLHFVSTLMVFPLLGGGDDTGPQEAMAYETSPLDHSEQLFTGYAQTKWVAEKLVMAARDRGLPVTIHRPGRITAHSQTGVGEADDLMWSLVRMCIQIGAAPALDMEVDMSPVDFVAAAIADVSLQPHALGKAFHLVNPHPIHWKDLLDWIRAFGYPLDVTSLDEFQRRATEFAGSHGLMELLPLLSLLSADDIGDSFFRVRYDCRNTLEHTRESQLVCPPVDDALLSTYFAQLVHSKFLDTPRSVQQRQS